MPGLGDAVVGAGGAALGDPGDGGLGDDVLDRERRRLDGRRAGGVADRAEAHEWPRTAPRRRASRDVAVDGHQHPVAAEHLAVVGEVQRRQLDLALGDEAPDVELGPVRQREHAQVLAAVVAGVVDPPQLGPLVLRVPLAELVAVRHDALLGPGPLLVAAGAAEHGVEAVLGDGVEQRDGLQRVAACRGAWCPRGRDRCRSSPARRPRRARRRSRRRPGRGTR